MDVGAAKAHISTQTRRPFRARYFNVGIFGLVRHTGLVNYKKNVTEVGIEEEQQNRRKSKVEKKKGELTSRIQLEKTYSPLLHSAPHSQGYPATSTE